jgi:hypothetical protein
MSLSFTDVDRQILQCNLFGMDLNPEAVEICRLSLWIKTAQVGKVLTSLDDNVKQGNSVVAEPSPLDAWRQRFPVALAEGGFDVVIGNPPYVRQEWIAKDKPFLEKHYRAYDGVADLYVYFYELGMKLLKSGGRLGFVVTNKWMRAGYGEALRKFFGECAWVDQVVDFGHAKQIFPDADVFPSILVARKPMNGPSPASARVCAIPREQLRIDDLSRQIKSEGYDVPRDRLGAEPWSLERQGATTLMERIKSVGVPLREFAGVRPLLGIKTALNEAFLLNDEARKRLVELDPRADAIIRPYLRGQDIDRWTTSWAACWMIVLKSSNDFTWPWSDHAESAEAIFRRTYPSVFDHLNRFREAAIKRQDQGRFWWELRTCAFWEAFKSPEIWFQQIQFHPSYALDAGELYGNNKTTFLPCRDLFLLAVLNSPLMWWYSFRFLPHMKDEALAPVNYKVEEFPIAKPTDECRAMIEPAVRRLIDITTEQQAGRRAVLDWLRLEFDVEKPSQKLQDMTRLDATDLAAEVKKARGRSKLLSVGDVKRLKEEHVASVVPLQTLADEASSLERLISDLVNGAYGLTPDEIALMWETAPPRMPTPRPTT